MMMAGPYAGTLSDLPTVRDEVTCSINAENPTGAKGFGCRETGPLGPSRKGKPCSQSLLWWRLHEARIVISRCRFVNGRVS